MRVIQLALEFIAALRPKPPAVELFSRARRADRDARVWASELGFDPQLAAREEAERQEWIARCKADGLGIDGRIAIVAAALVVMTAINCVAIGTALADPWGKDTDVIRAGMIGTAYEKHSVRSSRHPRGRHNEAQTRSHADPRPRAWCGWWLRQHFGIGDRSLNVARLWARIGHPAAAPAPGVVAVWPHHVGVITAVPGPGRIVLLSGNDGHAVRNRERSTRGIIALRVL